MTIKFFFASPYRDEGIDPEKIAELWGLFAEPSDEKICFVLTDGHPVGMFAGMITQPLFNRSKIACEVVWWIEPEYRNYKNARAMEDAYVYWAKTCGAERTQLVSLDDKDLLYKRMKYEVKEHVYVKALAPETKAL